MLGKVDENCGEVVQLKSSECPNSGLNPEALTGIGILS